MSAAHRRRHPRRGATLLEIALLSALLLVILGSLGVVTRSSSDLVGTDMVATSVRMDAWRAASRISGAMASVGGASIDPPLDPGGTDHSDVLAFQSLLDVSATPTAAQLTWQAATRVSLAYDEAETNNGQDDDGDGLIDECQILLTVAEGTTSEHTSALVANVAEFLEGETLDGTDNNGNGLVDERGLCFSRDGDVLHLRLTLARRDEDGRPILATIDVPIGIRN